MMQDNELSTQPIESKLITPRDPFKQPLIDYDFGPIAIGDPSQGVMNKVWKGYYDGNGIVYTTDVGDVWNGLVVSGVEDLSITFDQNGHPFFAFKAGNSSYFQWFDPISSSYQVVNIGYATYNPRVILDDKRQFNIGDSDVLLFYMKGLALHMRLQRDRFSVDYIIEVFPAPVNFNNVWYNAASRLEFKFQMGEVTNG